MLTVTEEIFGDTVVLHCQGRMVRGTETPILCAAIQQHGRNIVLDLSKVDAIDAAGIGALVSLQAAGIYLKLMSLTRPVREVFGLTKLDSVFEICELPLEGEADASMCSGASAKATLVLTHNLSSW
jgi:anti-anti-sigma factor